MYEAAHGRGSGSGNRSESGFILQNLVFTYQGDGDLASIGAAEIVHAAARGEKITAIFHKQCNIRNDRRANGSDDVWWGRKRQHRRWAGMLLTADIPVRMSEMLATLEGSAHIERVYHLHDVPHIIKAKKSCDESI